MKSFQMKQLMPHAIAVIIFLLVTVIFCKPALDSDLMLKQGDTTGWQGMSHQSYVYKEKNGHLPLWVTSMFSGMPAYQIAIEGDWSPLGLVDHAIQLWLPQPMNFFFLACIGFYFLCICLGIRPWASIIGSLGFAFCSFSPIIVAAGHNTQMLALGYAPAVMGAVILVFNKKYLVGFSLATLLTALQIAQGHQQISYYLFLILLAMTVAYAIRFFREGETGHFLKSAGILLVAGFIGLAVNAINLLPTYDYAKYSKRGGQLVMPDSGPQKDKVQDGKTTGLSKDYAFMWSYGKAETFSLMFPGVQGYGLHIAQREGEQDIYPKLDEKSNLAGFFSNTLNVPEDQAANYAMQQSGSVYWGDQPFTSGPVYLGAIICFLAILGMFILDGKHKWWIAGISLFGILLSWGHNLPGFNYFMFDYFPLYNKFRVPTMALVIPQICLPILASLLMEKWISGKMEAVDWKKFTYGLFATLFIFASALLYYASADYSNENRERMAAVDALIASGEKGESLQRKISELNEKYQPKNDNQMYEGMLMNFASSPDAQKMSREFLTSLRKDRAAFFMGDIIRSFIFVLIAAVAIALYYKQKLSAMVMLVAVTLVSTIDLVGFGMHYLNDKNYDSKSDHEATEFPLSRADQMILNDTDPHFRVFNTASLEESRTSYHHKSIGGYHPAKLGIYDDLIAYQLSGRPNLNVVNMLNAKYIIQRQGNDPIAMLNPGALGNAWFVKEVKFVNGPVEEMKALDSLNPAETAVVDASFKPNLGAFSAPDSSSFIKLTKFDNDVMTYQSSANASQLAVFSEVYYKDWNAYIDGKPAPHVKANYVLRAMIIPAGKHEIVFKFEPTVFYTGKTISTVSSWLVAALLVICAFLQFRNARKK